MTKEKKSLPGQIYRYRAANKFSFIELGSRSIWMASVASFNDPFEFASLDSDFDDTPENREFAVRFTESNMELPREAIEELLKTTDWEDMRESMRNTIESKINNRGVACLSLRVDSELMWGHYADGHRGFVVGYDTSCFPFSDALEVSYSDELARISFKEILEDPDGMFDRINSISTTKSGNWSYEDEYRIVNPRPNSANQSFRVPSEAIKSITFGAKTTNDDKSTVGRLVQDLDIEFYEARLSKKEYGLEVYRLEYDPQELPKNRKS